ncbi:MAG: 4Fe-4S binding protein [Methanomassiliicoccales archaeon]|nr:4Fe-4S binding protein [Methanomassiliicoccales archaeon]
MWTEDAVRHLEAKGFKASCLPFARMKDIRRDLDSLLEDGALVESFYEMHLTEFKYDGPDGLPNPNSVIVISQAHPALRTSFVVEGRRMEAIVPPGFGCHTKMVQKAKDVLNGFAPGHRFEFVPLPLKTLAARSGLARYGRNNVTYVEGFGSFHRLTALATDLECESDRWGERRMMERCEKCTTCVKVCPTRSIRTDRFLINGETCLTNLNEMPPDVPFPPTLDPKMHNAIVGCMICQMKCPENRMFARFIEDRPGFDENETNYLLKGDFSDEKKAKAMDERLMMVGLDLTIFPRTLVGLIEGERARTG